MRWINMLPLLFHVLYLFCTSSKYKSSRKSLFCYFFSLYVPLLYLLLLWKHTSCQKINCFLFCTSPILNNTISTIWPSVQYSKTQTRKTEHCCRPTVYLDKNDKQDITKLNKITRTWQHTGGYSQIFYRAKGNTSNDRYMH